MCTTCGCDDHSPLRIDGGGLHSHGQGETRSIPVEKDLLARNDAHARANRERFDASRVRALNLVSSPGSGKTALLVATLERLSGEIPMAVIEGDQETQRDADRIRATGVAAVQINTGKACHLDAHGVGHACEHMDLPKGGLLFIENVGNLVCPAAFDLGAHQRVLVLSVTEGDDKPFKYPDMFRTADALVINKLDLLPHVDFDLAACEAQARRLNPEMTIFRLSAHTGEGMEVWTDWLRVCRPQTQQANDQEELETLRRRVSELEARLQRAGLMSS
ncbi:hydrogenase nickel incorporation protein HypB [Ectothiorhodospira mobilis]|uniref:hydrogenase nickel incorporation protein HypB n=1 Tax=Ectothiorhodospira mobilis TaxID=195064 RepID=UPI001EE840AC|nr:hydrogenase nickel incorporation protein HypB [Ectothiorhodospira mobilis]MCG5535126.1 hydrogenase nickel incorporation protein HypB [Ectothiorhodospira mobilis]